MTAPAFSHEPETSQHWGARAPHVVFVRVPPCSFEVAFEGGDTGAGASGSGAHRIFIWCRHSFVTGPLP